MNNALKNTGIGRNFKNQVLGDSISINDLREREFKGRELSGQQALALQNFDRYRIEALNRQESEELFTAKYMELQAMANLTPYTEFLKEKYTG